MRVIIIDDEAPVLRLLKRVLESFDDVEVIGEYTNSLLGLQAIHEQQLDICFLDIEMPEMNGIQVAKELMDKQIAVVFVTAYSQYAVEAFKVNAVDYILKPITKDEVGRVLQKLRPRIIPKPHAEGLTIQFFREFTVSFKGEVFVWSTEKTAELFAYLIYNMGKKVDKWLLCEMLWPHVPPEKAKHNVYNAMYILKKLLNHHGVQYDIVNTRGYYEFTIEQAQIDFLTMNNLLAQHKKIDKTNFHVFERAELLYTGEFLATKDYEWSQSLRVLYAEHYQELVIQLLDFYIAEQLEDKAEALGKKVLQKYPELEDVAVNLIPLYEKKSMKKLQQFYKEYSKRFEQEFHSSLSDETIDQFEQALKHLNEL